jgi:hypothetical protein
MNTWIYLLNLYSTWIRTVLDVRRVHQQRGYPCFLHDEIYNASSIKLMQGHRMISVQAQGFPAMQRNSINIIFHYLIPKKGPSIFLHFYSQHLEQQILISVAST